MSPKGMPTATGKERGAGGGRGSLPPELMFAPFADGANTLHPGPLAAVPCWPSQTNVEGWPSFGPNLDYLPLFGQGNHSINVRLLHTGTFATVRADCSAPEYGHWTAPMWLATLKKVWPKQPKFAYMLSGSARSPLMSTHIAGRHCVRRWCDNCWLQE